MITNVKMQVNEDLLERIESIYFKNGIYWSRAKEKNLECDYIYISKNSISYYNNKKDFNMHNIEEISAYDFIASQGEQKWLPKYNEEAAFSNDGINYRKGTFVIYEPECGFPYEYIDKDGYVQHSKYCEPIKKQVFFVQFLKDNNVYEKYMQNIKIENQRWSRINDYISLKDLKKLAPEEWIFKAFNWGLQKEKFTFWTDMNNRWRKLIENKNDIVWE